MKLPSLLIAAVLVSSSYLQAAVSVTTFNFIGNPTSDGLGNAIVFDTGLGVANPAFIGGFNTTLPALGNPATSWASIVAAFTQNGSSLAATVPGLYNGAVGNAATSTDGSDPFTPGAVYVIIGNAATLAGSTDGVIFQGPVWPNEIAGIGATVNFQMSTANLVRGQTTENVLLTAPFTGFNSQTGITFGAVPEPSTALLGALGALGLLRRRRN